MNVYLLNIDGEKLVFYSEGPPTGLEVETPLPKTGIRGWAERRYKRLQVLLTESEKGVGLRVRRTWEWLQKRIALDEPMLRSLRGAREVKLYHSHSINGDEVPEMWRGYLKSRQGRHTFWLVVDTAFCPLVVLLAPLPGPNVIGYWFVYRAVCHWLARVGARNVRRGQIATEFLSTEALDGSLHAEDHERIARVSSSFGLTCLETYIHRFRHKRKRARRKAPLTAS